MKLDKWQGGANDIDRSCKQALSGWSPRTRAPQRQGWWEKATQGRGGTYKDMSSQTSMSGKPETVLKASQTICRSPTKRVVCFGVGGELRREAPSSDLGVTRSCRGSHQLGARDGNDECHVLINTRQDFLSRQPCRDASRVVSQYWSNRVYTPRWLVSSKSPEAKEPMSLASLLKPKHGEA